MSIFTLSFDDNTTKYESCQQNFVFLVHVILFLLFKKRDKLKLVCENCVSVFVLEREKKNGVNAKWLKLNL